MLLAHLTHPRLRHGEACPITRPTPGHRPPADLRAVALGDVHGFYGQGNLWAYLPAGQINGSRDPNHGWYREKVAWLVGVPGPLRIAARRIDHPIATLGPGDIASHAPTAASRSRAHQHPASHYRLLAVAGGVGTSVVTWIFDAHA